MYELRFGVTPKDPDPMRVVRVHVVNLADARAVIDQPKIPGLSYLGQSLCITLSPEEARAVLWRASRDAGHDQGER